MANPRGIQPVRREPAAVAIANQLTQAVMDGVLTPGQQLGEVDLASRLGVSRGPLREAMQRLVQQGILRSEPHRGVFVASLTGEDVNDIYAARTAVEAAACRLVLRAQPQRAADAMAQALQVMADAVEHDDRAALVPADLELHRILVAESGSPRLQRMEATLLVETRMCLSARTVDAERPAELVDHHTAIIDALRERDETLLVTLVEEHLCDAVRRLAPPTPAGEPAPGASVDAQPA